MIKKLNPNLEYSLKFYKFKILSIVLYQILKFLNNGIITKNLIFSLLLQ